MNFTKSKIFLILCLSFVVGVLVAPWTSRILTVAMAVFFVTLISVWWNTKLARVVGFAGLVLLAGVLRFGSATSVNNLSPYYDQNSEVAGVIIEEPDIRDDKIYLTLGKIAVNGRTVKDKILVSVYPNHNFAYGDELDVKGKIQEPAVFDDFNYKNYLSRYGIDAVMYYPEFEVTANNKGNPVKASLLKIKHKFAENLSQVLPEPQNALLGGILVGEKRSIPKELSDQFNATGTSHIVAISGYNITIIVWALDLILRRFGKKLSSTISLMLIVGFVILTGGAASAIRAAIIGSLGLVALNIGRLQNITNAMALTSAVMIFINPKILHYDVGFQLSFLALCGLVYLSPIITFRSRFIPDWVSRGLTATLAAQIFTLPILLYNFDRLSVVAPLTNVLVLEIVPPVMGLGFSVGVIWFLWPALAELLAWPLWILLSYIIKIVQLTSQIPYASIGLHIQTYGVVIYYCILAALLVWYKLKSKSELEYPEGFTKLGFSDNLYRH